MTHSASLSKLPPEFDDFLYAPIGEDGHGMPVSVLSVLARLDLDPWQEASRLARLPAKTAIQSLASSIAELPDGPSAHRDAGTIAAGLIGRLPRQAGSVIPAREKLPTSGAATNPQAVMHAIVINAIFIAVLLGAQWMMASHATLAPAPVGNAHHAPALSTVSPQPPALNSGRSRGGGIG
jgi:hypothetical protein